MTKEELEKEAEENSFRYTLDKPWVCEVERKQIMAHFEKGYLASAEPREKRIEELEQENKVLAQNLEDTEILNKTYEKRFDDLEKENAELKLKLEALKGQTPWKDIKDKSEVIGQLTNAKEIICEYVRLANLEKEDTIAIWQLYHKAEQFLKDCEVEK